MKKILFALVLCLALMICLLPATASAATTVSSVTLDLEFPEAGKVPPGTATPRGTGYGVYAVDWLDRETDEYLEDGDKIQVGHQYVATVWVSADSGYSFKCVNDNTPGVTARINGEDCEVIKAYEYKAWAMVCVNYYFDPVPAKGWVKKVDLTIPAPAAGEKPYYGQISASKYWLGNVNFSGQTNPNMKNGISWYEENGGEIDPATAVFKPNTAYTFHCLVFPQDGYRLTPNARITVNGQVAESFYDYATFHSVEYTFPRTGTASHTHTPGDWHYNTAEHYAYCTQCNEMINQADHTGGTMTCTEKPVCEVCGFAYGMEEPDHKWSPTYLYQDKNGHAWICANCKDHSPLEPHKAGPAATDTQPQTCTECGYVITPALNAPQTTEATEVTEATEPAATRPGAQKDPNKTPDATQAPQATEEVETAETKAPDDTTTVGALPNGGTTEDSDWLLWVMVIAGGLAVVAAGVLITVKVMKKKK